MHEFTLDDDKVKSLIKNKFIYIHINISEHDKVVYKDFVGNGRAFAKYMGFNLYPTSLFFDYRGELIYSALGFHDEVLFYRILKYIQTDSYTQMDYDSFDSDFDYYKDEY
jgi:thioredoxin-related protein